LDKARHKLAEENGKENEEKYWKRKKTKLLKNIVKTKHKDFCLLGLPVVSIWFLAWLSIRP
jgi:hypothetical protein